MIFLAGTTTMIFLLLPGIFMEELYSLGVNNFSKVKPLVAVERSMFQTEKGASLYFTFPYALAQVSRISLFHFILGIQIPCAKDQSRKIWAYIISHPKVNIAFQILRSICLHFFTSSYWYYLMLREPLEFVDGPFTSLGRS